MLSRIAKFALTITAIAPVLLTYSGVAFLKGEAAAAIWLFGGFLILSFICLWLLHYVKNKVESMPFRATSVEIADGENIAFLMLYLFPLLTGRTVTPDWQIWLPAILVFGTAVAVSYSYHFNPVLGFLGWHFYKASTEEGVTYVIVSKKQFCNINQTIEIGQMTEYIVVDLGGK